MSGVQIAWAYALSESTLVFFTTLAPSAAFAYLALLILLFRSGIDTVIHEQIHHLLWAPLVLCMIGLIMWLWGSTVIYSRRHSCCA